jgi:hypothetical protein
MKTATRPADRDDDARWRDAVTGFSTYLDEMIHYEDNYGAGNAERFYVQQI